MRAIDGVEMLSVREAAQLAGRTPETVRRWVWSGRLPARRDGNRLLVARADVMRLAAGQQASRARGGSAYSLAQWTAEVVAAHGRGRRGASASDLVLADRSERDAGAGR
jgi:excisionase family DNA binding protein